MKKWKVSKVCYAVSILLVAAFFVNTIVDYGRYNNTLNSAPFSLWGVVNLICFIVPAVIALVVGIVVEKRNKAKGE